MAKTASISMEIDSGIKERTMAVLEARHVAVRRREEDGDPRDPGAPHPLRGDARPGVRRGGHERRPGEAVRHRQGGARRTGVPTGMVVKMEPEFKREMRRYCSDMCVTPNGLVHMFLGQVAFELRVPFDD